jgi:alkylation response protein AidB-like acyl-CoA dehydrogenase
MITGRSAEQEAFAASLHDMLAAADVPGAARRWAAGDPADGLAVWRKLAGAGVTGLAVPERWGGLGAGPLDIVVACEELGHHALPGPVAESVAVVPWLITALASDAGEPLAARWLPGLAAGDLIATVALPPVLPYAADADVAGLVPLAGNGTYPGADTSAGRRAEGSANAAGLVLLGAGDVIWLAEPGARHRSVDRCRSLFEASGRDVLARGPAAAAAIARALDVGALACAAQLLGAGRALLAAGVRHAGQRIQFGRPVGAFQAVKHLLADGLARVDLARAATLAAAVVADDPASAELAGAHAPEAVAAAKVLADEAAAANGRTGVQVHGGMGFTWEVLAHLYLKRAWVLETAFGAADEHAGYLAQSLAAGPGERRDA